MTSFTSLKSWMLLAVLLVTGSVVAQTNLLSNASFEEWNDGKPVHWVSTTTAGNATLAQSDDALTGSSSVLVKGVPSSNKRLAYEEITLKPGTYTFTINAKAATAENASCRPGYAPIKENGSMGSYAYGDYVNDITNAEWVKASYEFTLTEETHLNLVVMNSGKPGKDLLLDDASLTTTDGGIVEGGESPEPTPDPDPSGESSKENPYTVAVAIEKFDAVAQPETWVKGYIVGYVVAGTSISETSAIFGAEGENVSNTNLLIADAVTEKDYTKCLVIQLPAGDVREALNLKENPGNLGKPVVLMGSLDKYFGTYGLKSVTDYVLDGESPEPDPTVSFAKATTITSGKRYALVVSDGEKYHVAQNIAESSNYGYLYVGDITVSNDEISTEESNSFTITAVDGGYTIQDSYGRYLYMKGTFNSFNVSSEQPESGYIWNIDIAADGLATITNVEMNKWVQYSTQYTSFGVYPDEQGLLPSLYMEKGGSSVTGVGADAFNAPVEVYTLGGVKVGSSLNGLQKGIYIIKQGGTVKKVMK